jgi:hypothetical protein
MSAQNIPLKDRTDFQESSQILAGETIRVWAAARGKRSSSLMLGSEQGRLRGALLDRWGAEIAAMFGWSRDDPAEPVALIVAAALAFTLGPHAGCRIIGHRSSRGRFVTTLWTEP